MNSGENSNSVGGVPIDIRPRISVFSWLGCGFGWDSRLLLKHHGVLLSSFSVTSVTRGYINSGQNSNSVGGVTVDIRPALLDFRGSAAFLAWIPSCCSSIMLSFLAGLSVTSVTGGDIKSGENSNSVGGVPVNIRPRIAGFSWLGCGFGLDSSLLRKGYHAVLFVQLFGDKCHRG
jgi:hypothetical protein